MTITINDDCSIVLLAIDGKGQRKGVSSIGTKFNPISRNILSFTFLIFCIVLSKEQTLCYCLASSEKQILWVLRQVPNILRFRTLAMFNYLIRIKRKIYGMTRERRHLNSMGKESYFKAKHLAASPEVTSSQKLKT